MSDGAPNRVRKLFQAIEAAEEAGVDMDTSFALCIDLMNAITKAASAKKLAQVGACEASARAGDEALSTALTVMKRVAGDEINRVLLAGFLDVDTSSPDARSTDIMSERIQLMKTHLNGQADADIVRTSARNGLSKILCALDGLVDNNFLAVCSGSLLAVSHGDTNKLGWLAAPPKLVGRKSDRDGTNEKIGYVKLLAESYYSAGFNSTPVTKELELCADQAGVKVTAILGHKSRQRLQPACDYWRELGRDDAAANRPRQSSARLPISEAGRLLATRKRRGSKRTNL